MCCFCLESYVNSFAYFLIKDADFLGLAKSGRESSAEAVLDAFYRSSTREKWETIGKMGSTMGFDRSRTPFQDFRSLFNFRDDMCTTKLSLTARIEQSNVTTRNFPICFRFPRPGSRIVRGDLLGLTPECSIGTTT
jgi:hypothetical protein